MQNNADKDDAAQTQFNLFITLEKGQDPLTRSGPQTPLLTPPLMLPASPPIGTQHVATPVQDFEYVFIDEIEVVEAKQQAIVQAPQPKKSPAKRHSFFGITSQYDDDSFASPMSDPEPVPVQVKKVEKKIKLKHAELQYKDNSVYVGQVDEATSRRFGRGRLTTSNGDIYDGGWQNDKRHGQGLIQFGSASPLIHFTGTFAKDEVVNDQQSSLGCKNGERYVGFCTSKIVASNNNNTNNQASTTTTTASNNSAANNNTNSGAATIVILKHGQGELHFPNGDCYFGYFAMDKMHGYGVYTYANQEQYYGNFDEGKKSGYGVFAFKDGTIFEGQWKHDVREGYGELKLPNGDRIIGQWSDCIINTATYKKGTFENVSIYSSMITYEKAHHFADASFSHPRLPTVPKEQLSGDKWTSLSAHFTTNIEEDKRRMLMSAEYASFKQTQGEKTPASPTSATFDTHFNQILKRIESELSNSQSSLFQMIHLFKYMFHGRYHDAALSKAKYLLPQALDDFFSFLSLMQKITMYICSEAKVLFGMYGKPMFSVLKNYIAEQIYDILFPLYTQCYQEQDSKYKLKLDSLKSKAMQDLGIKERLIPPPQLMKEEPYQDCINLLRTISVLKSPNDKFKVLVEVSSDMNYNIEFSDQMKKTGKKGELGSDDLFPLFLYIFIKANIPHMYSEFQFMNHFNDEAKSNGEEGYRFVNFELAMKYVERIDVNIRDKGVIVDFSLLENKLDNAVQSVYNDCKKQSKPYPKLSFLYNIFLEVANCQNDKLDNGYILDCSALLFSYFKDVQGLLKSTQHILAVVGISLQTKSTMTFDSVAAKQEQEPEKQEASDWTPIQAKKKKMDFDAEHISFVLFFDQIYPSYVYTKLAEVVQKSKF